MSDKLQLLKNQSKLSMQALIDRALVQDEVSQYKRFMLIRAHRLIGVFVSVPIGLLFCFELFKHSEFYKTSGFSAGNFMLAHRYGVRELYAPEVYEKDQKLRPYEVSQFR